MPTQKRTTSPKRTAKPSPRSRATVRNAAAKKPSPSVKKTAAAKTAARTRTTRTPAKSAVARPAVPRVGATSPPRRAIFIDVENTSNEESLTRVIEGLKIDRAAQPTEFYAVGNWRACGQGMSRHLARLGATLVHSAPVTGVRDWSDLWIAVTAGRWIATAKPGDSLEIVSDDKAFEAVGDVAASCGITFRRVLHRVSATAAAHAESARDDESGPPRRRRRGGRGGRGRRRNGAPKSMGAATAHTRAPRSEAARTPPAPKPEPQAEAPRPAAIDGHGASHEQIIDILRRLTGGDPNRWVNLDVIINALKSEGFGRPPGSPRLVVRLRRMKDVEVQPNGMVRLLA